MKFLAIIALATAAIALPTDGTTPLEGRAPANCKPGTYVCKTDNSGWLVCNVDGNWLDGGKCNEKTSCEYINGLPYCT